MGFIKARGSNLYYEEKGEGPPILLIPPSGATASTWGAVFGDLAGAGRVIAYDRRGYGRSGGEVVRSASEHALDAAAVLEAADAWPAVAVGTSAGATIALDLAVRRPAGQEMPADGSRPSAKLLRGDGSQGGATE